MRRFFGKYRGKVTANKDPFNLGRIQVSVPAIYGEGRTSWALPCTPFAGKNVGLFMVPPINANVWVEFEGGDPDYPIWAGCFWGTDELPQNARVDDPVKVQVFQTEGITLTLSSLDGKKGITLEVKSPVVENPLKMVFNADGIELNNKDTTKIKLMVDTIELQNGQSSTVTIKGDSIQLKEGGIEEKLTNNSIELTCNPASIKLSTASGVEIANAPANAKFSSAGVEISNAASTVKVGGASLDLTNTAASIRLSPVSVNINNGALEVI
ncbi:MAG: phage baseplate assembly protein V [Synechococcales bacterium]|nr:phage baseplate assembly protein V [Synechococcales bacterium]